MPVNNNIAERLIPYASAEALDVLFRSGGQYPSADHVPSTELVMARWSEMTADSAENIARAASDPALLDYIAAKDKRKGVRFRVATNPNTHPVTREYFLQEALRHQDHELLSGVFKSMPHDTVIEHWVNDPSLHRRISKRNIVEAIVSADVARAAALLSSFEDVSWIAIAMLQHDTDRALVVIDAAGIELSSLSCREWPGSSEASIASIRRLIGAFAPERRGRVIDDLLSARGTTAKVINEIDPGLLDAYVRAVHTITTDDVDTIIAAGRTRVLFDAIQAGARLDSDITITRLLPHVGNAAERATLAITTRDDELAARLVDDPATFVEGLGERTQGSNYLSFIRRVADGLQRDTVITLLSAAEPGRIGAREVMYYAEKLHMTFIELLEQLPSAVLASLDSIPSDADARQLLALAAKDSSVTELKTAALVIRHHEDPTACVNALELLLLASPVNEGAAQWVLDASVELVEPLMTTHREAFAELFNNSSQSAHRVSWLPTIIDRVRARNGWGQLIVSRNVTAPAMTHLQNRVGLDTQLWETVLNLLPDWTGTLDELVDSAAAL